MNQTPSIQTIGKRIREARLEAGLTVTGLAAAIGFHVDTVTRYEQGTSKRGPTYLDVVYISNVTGKPVDFFMHVEKEKVA